MAAFVRFGVFFAFAASGVLLNRRRIRADPRQLHPLLLFLNRRLAVADSRLILLHDASDWELAGSDPSSLQPFAKAEARAILSLALAIVLAYAPAMRVSYAIVFVSDMKRSVAFYRDVFGLPLKFDSPEWSEFATEGATLALHRSDEPPTTGDESESPPGRCRPGLNVPDLDAFHLRMVEHNVICTQQPKDLFGAKIAEYLDPDGLAISVSEDRR